MKTSQKVLLLYFLFSALFIVGSIIDIRPLTIGATYFLVPSLILYYRYKAKKWFLPMVIALLLFYLRDILITNGYNNYADAVIFSFGTATFILYVYAFTGFQKSKIHFVEGISLLIMYGFLGFLFYTVGELVPQVMTTHRKITYIYLLLVTLLLAITFTQYILKSHFASLWLMLAAAALLVSELSLFFKFYIVSDISVNVFYPLFHIIAYYAMVQHVLYRRKSSKLPGF